MKKLALAAVFAGAASTAFAGGYKGGKWAEPIIEPEIIIEDTHKSAAGIVVPLMLLVLVAAAVVATR